MKRCGLSKSEKIKSKKDFERLFTKGTTYISSGKEIKINYAISVNAEFSGVSFAVAVSKKSGTAVWRNRIKRLIRVSYRKNKSELVNICKSKRARLEIIFSPYELNQALKKHVKLNDIEPTVIEIITKLKYIV
ncbi:MAG: ribonuclease P protein component [Ignavibacteriaceae bacterium]|nr:ribonuclease P protein component [Ignavibacteriaceae bacterium]